MTEIFDWQEFLRFAQKIYAEVEHLRELDDSDESLCRIGISRAYYAAFHVARNYLLELEPNFSSGLGEGSHQAIIKAFTRFDDKYRRQIGNKLAFLKDMRVRADYNERRYRRRGEMGNAVLELKMATNYAEKILAIIKRCRQDSKEG